MKSVKGISRLAIYAECLNCLTMIADSDRLNMSFGVYGEAIFILGQNLIIIGLIWDYNDNLTAIEKFLVVVGLLYTSYIVFIVGVSEKLYSFFN